MRFKGQQAPTCDDIELLARAAIAGLPPLFRAHLDHVVLIVEEFADAGLLSEMKIEIPFDLSGLYSGRPVGETAATGDLPPTIHLFRRPIIDEWAETGERLDDLVRHIPIHEVGHHFGLSDEDISALEDAAD